MVETDKGRIIEFPQSVVNFGLFKLSCFGGGYFRLFPESFFILMSHYIEKNNRPLILYIHPRHLDPGLHSNKFSIF